MITEADIEEHLIEDEQGYELIAAEQPQPAAETRLCEEINFVEVEMTATVTSSELTNLDRDEILSGYARNLPRDPINLESINQHLNSVDKYESCRRFQVEPVIPPELILDLELQLLSPHMESL